MVAPVFWATGNAVLAYNVAVVLALVLSALALFLLARAIGLGDGAAFAGGLVYAFNSFTQHELARVHVLHVQWWPLALVFLDRFARERPSARRRRPGRAPPAAGALRHVLPRLHAGAAPVWLLAAWLVVRPPAGSACSSGPSCFPCLAAACSSPRLILWPYVAQFRAMGFDKSWAGGADLLSYVAPPAQQPAVERPPLPRAVGAAALRRPRRRAC